MAAKKQKRITRRNKKTGEVKYYYYEILGKENGKQILGKGSEISYYKERGAKERKSLSLDEAIDYLEYLSADFETIQSIKLDYRTAEKVSGAEAEGRTYTKAGLESKVRQRHMGRTENFLAQLGFSLTEFSDAFGVSSEYVLEKGFEKIGNVTYQLRGTDLTFVWDYERGLTEG